MTPTTTHAFCRYDLRTLDAEAARAFYTEVVGLDFDGSSPDPSPLGVWPLHEQARARGAPPHWLGHVRVADAEATATRLVTLGSERLGPTQRAADGASYATMRDPFGAVFAVRAVAEAPRRAPVAWHHLHTRDLDGAWAAYAGLFGWTHTETVNVPFPPGGYRAFAWDSSGKSVGSMANTARDPGVHAHWLFFFPVADLDAAIDAVRARGGRVVEGATPLAGGRRLVPCEDPQGAAFGLCSAR